MFNGSRLVMLEKIPKCVNTIRSSNFGTIVTTGLSKNIY